MKVLIVQDNADLGLIWSRFLERQGHEVVLATHISDAFEALRKDDFDAMVLEPILDSESGFAVADFAAVRQPDLPIIAVTKSSFFSDGSIFQLLPNARGFMRLPLRPDDLQAYLEHCARKSDAQRNRRESIAG